MRLWTLHPKYLDSRGLVALWREALLAQAVLRNRTRGYTRHPQLLRFRRMRGPVSAIAAYLRAIHAEAAKRGHHFAGSKIARGGDGGRRRSSARSGKRGRCTVTAGQVEFERQHLLAKLWIRDRERHDALAAARRPELHPLFEIVPGGVEDWERGTSGARVRRKRA